MEGDGGEMGGVMVFIATLKQMKYSINCICVQPQLLLLGFIF